MKNRDLTQGNISAHLLRLALPLMLGNILQQMYNTIASLVVNRYAGGLEYAATGVSSSVMNLFLFIVIFSHTPRSTSPSSWGACPPPSSITSTTPFSGP